MPLCACAAEAYSSCSATSSLCVQPCSVRQLHGMVSIIIIDIQWFYLAGFNSARFLNIGLLWLTRYDMILFTQNASCYGAFQTV